MYSRRTYHIETFIPNVLYISYWHIHNMYSIHRMLTHSYHIFQTYISYWHIHAMVWMCQYDMFGTHDMNVSIWYMVSNHEQDLGLCLDVPASLGLGLASKQDQDQGFSKYNFSNHIQNHTREKSFKCKFVWRHFLKIVI